MDMRKCCVMDCNSTSRTHRLYNIPRNDRLRELWLSFLIPMNIGLTGLSKEQLVTKRVCQNHFDRYQFDNVGNRLTYGYPCLFSAKEVYHGIPLPTYAQNHMSDHNYCLNTTDAEEGFSETIATFDVKENLRSGEKVSETMVTTAEAVEFMDKLFDSVNGSRRSTTKGKLRGPIKPTSTNFAFWREAKEILNDTKFIDCCSKKAISTQHEYFVRVPSLDGWNTTIDSMERISKLLFENYGILYFYPRNLNQDPLENFFGRIRALNYRNVSPDANTFVNSFKSLLISNVMGPHSIYSNCEDDTGETIIDFVNLLKRTNTTNNKENIDPSPTVRNIMLDPNTSTAQTNSSTHLLNQVISERTKVHSSAYTAGYLCRKMTKKMNCIRCNKTFTALEKENIHEWIAHREYRGLKHSNLSYPSKEFLILYRDIADFIHSYMNKFAYQKNVGHNVRHVISSQFRLQWLGCEIHNKVLSAWLKTN